VSRVVVADVRVWLTVSDDAVSIDHAAEALRAHIWDLGFDGGDVFVESVLEISAEDHATNPFDEADNQEDDQ